MEPAALGRGDAFSAYENFSVGSNHHVLSFYHLTQRSALHVEWMVDGDHGTCLGQTISLNNHKSEPRPEFFDVGLEPSSAHDECPELPSKRRMNAPELPPAADPGHARGVGCA